MRRKMKLIQTLSDILILSLPWLRIFETHQKDLRLLLEDISISKKMRSCKNVENGKSMLKKDRPTTLDWSMIIIIHGQVSSKSPKHNTNKCLIKLSKNFKNNWTSFQHQKLQILLQQNKLKNKQRRKSPSIKFNNYKSNNYNNKPLMSHMTNTSCQQSLNKSTSQMKKSKIDGVVTSALWVLMLLANNLKLTFLYLVSIRWLYKLSKILF